MWHIKKIKYIYNILSILKKIHIVFEKKIFIAYLILSIYDITFTTTNVY